MGQQHEDAVAVTANDATAYLQRVRDARPRLLADYSAKRATLEREIVDRWKRAFDGFDFLVLYVQDVLTNVDRELYPDAVARKDVLHEALRDVTLRACQTAKEVRVLMGAGYAPAAGTRWRVLHELHVVASLLELHKMPLAERFLRHDVVEKDKLATDAEKMYTSTGEAVPPPLAQAIADVRSEYAKLQVLYASEPEFFRGDYGWASGFVKPTTMRGLEAAASLSDRRSAYRLVSGSVHPNVAGTFAGSVTTPEGKTAIVLGPSSEGMYEPGVSAALALTDITRIYLQGVGQPGHVQPDVARQFQRVDDALTGLFDDTVTAFKADAADPSSAPA